MKIINWVKGNYIVLGIIIVAVILRFYHIDYQSVWLDEIHTINESNPQNTLKEVYNQLLISEPHPPLYFILMNFIFKIFGYTTLVLRCFSAFIGVLGVYFIYLLGKEIYNKKIGIYASILLSINYFHICYSQEGRMYVLLFLTSILSFYFLIKFIKKPNYKSAFTYSIFSVLMIYCHFFALFTLVSQYFILLFFIIHPFKTTTNKLFLLSFMSGITSLILYLPSYSLFKMTTEIKSIWIPMPTLDVYTQFFKDFFGQSEIVIFFIIVLLMFFFIKLFKIKRAESKFINPENDKLIFGFFILFVWISTTLLLPLIRSYTSLPMLINRYFINILPAVLLIISFGLYFIENKIVRNLILVLIVVFSITDIVIVKKYYSSISKAQFRESTDFIIKNNLKKEPVVSSLAWYMKFFLKNDKVNFEIIEKTMDEYISEMQIDSTKIKPFWFTDGFGRDYKPSESTLAFINKYFYIDNNFDGFQAWTKHFILLKDMPQKIDISKFGQIKEENGDKILFNFDSYQYSTNTLKFSGWSFLDNQDANDSKIVLVLIRNNQTKILPIQKVERKDVTSFFNKNKFNLDNTGFICEFNTTELPKGTYKLAIYIENKKTKKSGLILTKKIIER